jgi:hypothetical protein
MGALDPVVERTLDEMVPPRPQPDRWAAIMAEADVDTGVARRRQRRWLIGAVPALGLVAAVVVVAVAWPFGGGPGGSILERAAAAIGDGPVLHVVVRSGWGGTLINLESGKRSQLHGEEEMWFDPQRGIHQVSSFGGVPQGDALYPPGRVSYLDKTLGVLATGYRRALEDGSARVIGKGIVDTEAVYWLRVDTQMLPDVADNKLHEWAHDVAVSQSSFEPVATRETRDGAISPDGISTIEWIETLPKGGGNFTRMTPDRNGTATMRGGPGEKLTRAQANELLGGRAVWAGASVAGLELVAISKEERVEGYDPQTKTWAKRYFSVTLSYGALAMPGHSPSGSSVQVSESPTLDFGFQRGVIGYSPPEGSVLIVGGRIGLMQRNGVYIALEASDDDLLLATARALEPLPGS